MKNLSRYVTPLLTLLYRLWCATLRYTVEGREGVDAYVKAQKPLVTCFWHDEMFSLMPIRKDWPLIAIVSQSKDGEYLAGVLEAIGMETARGSSSRGGIRALLTTAKRMRTGDIHGCITVDGPRGPRHQVKEGAIFLAHKTPAHLAPVRGIFAGQQIKPQARTLAADRGIEWRLIDYDALRGLDNADERLF